MLYWIWLSLSLRIGSKSFKKLLSRGLSPEEIYRLDEESITEIIGTRTKDAQNLLNKDTKRAEEILNFCTSKGVGILTYSDEKYPRTLKEIENPPVLLYYRGVLPSFNSMTAISVVGSRTVSDYGRRFAFEISRALSLSGALIVSGMAFGIDGISHAAALSADAPTVAIIGSGIDVCYPIQHRTLAKNIVKGGCVLTEYPPGVKPERYNFPMRNRIIAALSHATVLIEGSEKSGALITAGYAKDFSRKVYALPANIGKRGSEAPILAIKNGATPISSYVDIISDFERTEYPLNPFKASSYKDVDINSVLTQYSVVATAPSDNVFNPSHRETKREEKAQNQPLPFGFDVEMKTDSPSTLHADKEEDSRLCRLDKVTSALYSKIPKGEAVFVESLVSDGIELPKIMSSLLRLEVLGLVTMLPGDRVKRV